MRLLMFLLLTSGGLAAAGCGSGSPAATSGPEAVTVEAWKSLPPDEKYTVDTFERLKLGDPKLQDQREWDRFTKAVLIPNRKKDGR
jgi:hypothetical protein